VAGAYGGAQQYEISVGGHLGETMRSAFPALRAQPRGPDTVLIGALPDQAALHGVLAEIEALGLELLEVRRVNPPDRTTRAHPPGRETSYVERDSDDGTGSPG
jgi:hypothetical protein